MGSHQLIRKQALGFFVLLVLGAFCLLVPFGQRTSAGSNPPVGTLWEKTVQINAGEPGELNGRWSVKLESANSQTVSLRYTFQGEFGFITDQVCNNPSSIPIPWNRLGVRATLSGGGTNAPPTFTDESLATVKLDYQAPAFVNCWAMVNPPPAYPSAVSYVRYSSYRFSAIQSGIQTEFFTELSTVVLRMTNDSSPAADVFVGASISIPTIGVDPETTTTKPQTSTTRAGAGSTPVENSAVVTTTTLLDEEAGIIIPTEGGPDGDSGISGNDTEADVQVVDVLYDMETETPIQEKERKKNTANSLVVTAAVLISALAAAAPALGAVSAAGAIGGVIGVTTSRSFSGGQLLPQVPKPTEIAVRNSKLITGKLKKIPELRSPPDVDLEQDFVSPSIGRATEGVAFGVGVTHVGRVFVTVISLLQYVSRIRIFRPGLRRWAEIALVSPTLAAVTPLLLLSCGGVLPALCANEIISSTLTMVVLFALAMFAPIFSIFVVVGWFVGRLLLDRGSLVVSVAESIALLPGLLFLPMMQRNLLGPRPRSRPWEHVLALVLAPCVAALAYRNWLIHFVDVTCSLCNIIVAPLHWTYGERMLVVRSESTALVIGVLMAIMIMVIAEFAVQFSDGDGKPKIMFKRFVSEKSPIQILRREYIDLVAVELDEPARWGRWWRYGLAGLLSTFVLFEVLGMRSVVLVVVFLFAVAVTKRFPRSLKDKEVHPIVKTVPMAAFGLLLGTFAVSPSRAFIAFAVVAVLAASGSLVRTRPLWDS